MLIYLTTRSSLQKNFGMSMHPRICKQLIPKQEIMLISLSFWGLQHTAVSLSAPLY
jgi:hypothetical protein